ncbi:transglycosylase SLT domain-containing protein [Streptomyces albidus (ex Kaewkla and Franco 2022)]|uniref:transglycosylase SLT domain-containing protein n=1 Tax=Streptomyces albidus (ex Kaewkla and Franco 2022) TaxID=722709 RepID=UPI0015EFBF62|nr:transglycosylase SLT domain-containing protein [Streptomyces albidus (ex Kaewkla and Franco 2022)]
MRTSAINRLTKIQKTTAIGLAATAGIAALSAAAPGSGHGGDAGHGPAKPVAGHSVNVADHPSKKAAQAATGNHAVGTEADSAAKSPAVHLAGAGHVKHKAESADQKQAEGKQPTKAERAAKAAEAAKAAKAERAAQAAKAEQVRKAKEARAADAADRSSRATKADNLDGWIKQARSIMKEEGIPGSYHGIKKNIIRESGGDPNAVNDWDINAQKGTPSKGLLQTIQPTFDAYHVKGTTHKVTDPVANIVAACNYAADKYGSMDNVNSAY